MAKEFTDEYVQRQKETFIDEFFTKQIKNYKEDDKRNMLTEISYEPSRVELKRAIKSLYKKYSRNFEWDEFISIIMLLVSESVYEFVPNMKKFDWSKLNEMGSSSNLILNKFVYNSYVNQIKDFNHKAQNKVRSSVRVNENGKSVKNTAIIENPQDSTDTVISLEDGDTSIIENIGGNSKYGYQNSLYHPNQFLHWFNSNRDALLAKSQAEFIEVMPKYFHEEGDDYTTPYSEDETQPFTDTARRNRMYRIRLKVNDLYDKSFPDGDGITLLLMKKQADLQLLNELIHIAYSDDTDDLSGLNTYISNWIHEQLNNGRNDVVSNLLHDNLNANELIHMNKSLHNEYPVSSQLIYKIISLVEDKIQQLEKFDTSNGGRAAGNSGWTKEDHQKYKDKLHRINDKTIKVYDLETGNFIGTEEVKREGRNYKVFRLNAFGMRNEVDELDVGID